MNKETLERTLKRAADGSDLIRLQEIASVLGYKYPYKVGRELCEGLPRFGKRFFIPDVAERILEKSEVWM